MHSSSIATLPGKVWQWRRSPGCLRLPSRLRVWVLEWNEYCISPRSYLRENCVRLEQGNRDWRIEVRDEAPWRLYLSGKVAVVIFPWLDWFIRSRIRLCIFTNLAFPRGLIWLLFSFSFRLKSFSTYEQSEDKCFQDRFLCVEIKDQASSRTQSAVGERVDLSL